MTKTWEQMNYFEKTEYAKYGCTVNEMQEVAVQRILKVGNPAFVIIDMLGSLRRMLEWEDPDPDDVRQLINRIEWVTYAYCLDRVEVEPAAGRAKEVALNP